MKFEEYKEMEEQTKGKLRAQVEQLAGDWGGYALDAEGKASSDDIDELVEMILGEAEKYIGNLVTRLVR